MRPADYLRDCRLAAGLTHEDVALCLDSWPPVSARRRAELLHDMEAGLVPIGASSVIALAAVPMMGIDAEMLAALVDGDEPPLRLVAVGRPMLLMGARA